MRRRLLALLAVPLLLAGCGTAAGPAAGGSQDRVLALSVSGALAEIVVDLGLADRLVGRDVSSTLPQTRALPVVTQAHQVSAEAVLALDPTLVLVEQGMGPPQALAALRRAGVRVTVVPEATSLDQVYPRMTAVAAALDAPAAGAELVARTRAQVQAAVASLPRFASPPRLAFLYLRGPAGVYLMAGRGSGADSLFRAIGAVDAGTAIGLERFRPLTSEGLVRARPDVLVVMTKGLASVGGENGLLDLAGVAQTPAGQHRRVVALDDASLLSFGPRTGEVVQQLARGVAAELSS